MNETSRGVRFKREETVVVGEVDPGSMRDPAGMKAFADHVVSVVAKYKGLALLLDFGRVAFLSSAALTELIRIREAVRGNGGELRLCGLSKDIYKVFEITRLDSDFGLRPDEAPAQAVARFKRDLAFAHSEQAAPPAAESARGT